MTTNSRKIVGMWLLAGVFMIVIQTLLGGITRLTESGLSITEWNVVSGTLPPLNKKAWEEEFGKYKQSSQYRLLNEGMQLRDFKRIFWWEYVHRLWARLFLPVFLIPLVYFIIRGMISWQLVVKSQVALALGAMQGFVGWIMVASGLKDRAWVGAAELTLHFMLAMILLAYMMWIALQTFNPPRESVSVRKLRPVLIGIAVLLFIQLCYGGLMAGNHAALFYPTWPKIGAGMIPHNIFQERPWYLNLINHAGMIQLIHRNLGYLVAALIFIYFFIARKKSATVVFKWALIALPLLVILQVLLGILTLLNSLGKIPITFAAAHQMCAVLLLLTMVILVYQVSMAGKVTGAPVLPGKKTVTLHQ